MNNQVLQLMLNKIASNNQALQNPMFINAMQMYKNGDENGLKQLADNLCRSKGTTPDQIMQQFNLR